MRGLEGEVGEGGGRWEIRREEGLEGRGSRGWKGGKWEEVVGGERENGGGGRVLQLANGSL